jgi:catechol 2,3-dioxygenase-like lactoylglutathione lyase family enzyme
MSDPMAWALEVVVVPVADLDRSKEFYATKLGFTVDHDTVIDNERRVIQLTPPGSACSVVIGTGVVPDMAPGSVKGLQLVVTDVERAARELTDRGVEHSGVQILGVNPAPTPHPLDNVGFVFFADPDGNEWAVQQISSRGA